MPQTIDLRHKIKQKISEEKKTKKIFKKQHSKMLSSELAEQKNSSLKDRSLLMAWEAPSFYYNPNKKYLSLIILSLAAGGIGIIFTKGNLITATFLLLSSLVIFLNSTRHPEMLNIVIDQVGVSIGELFHSYKDIKSFWIYYEPNGTKELSLELKRWYMPHIKVFIEKEDPLAIRTKLIKFIPEKEHEKSAVETIARNIGL